MRWRRKGRERKISRPRHAQAHAAEAQASEERKRLGDTRLLAPISGNISMRRVDPGQTVAAGTPVFSIVDLNPVKVRVGVPEAEIGKVKTAPRAEVSAPSLSGAPVRRESRNHRSGGRAGFAHVHGEDRRAQPRPGAAGGMVAEARIFGPAKTRVLTIPGEAIVHDPQGAPTCMSTTRTASAFSA